MKSKIFNIFLTIFLAMKKYDSKLEKICSKSNKLENKEFQKILPMKNRKLKINYLRKYIIPISYSEEATQLPLLIINESLSTINECKYTNRFLCYTNCKDLGLGYCDCYENNLGQIIRCACKNKICYAPRFN